MIGMYTDEIFQIAAKLCGEESELLGLLCSAAEKKFTDRLREGVEPADCRELLITAAALSASATYGKVTAGTGGAVSYKAGEVEVKRGGTTETLYASNDLQLQAEQMLAPYLTDAGFGFVGVKG